MATVNGVRVWRMDDAVMLEEMQRDDQRVKYLWEVLEKFSNEDRSRFLRFVTGRRRLPAVLHVVGGSVAVTFTYLPFPSTASTLLVI